MSFISTLLLDRDGTVIKDKHYLSEPRKVELLPGVGESLGRLAQHRAVRFFLISNQSGVGRGMFSMEAVESCNARMAELLRPYGVEFTDMLYCPHAPEEHCDCRKPTAGMWRTLKKRYGLKEEECLMVGDKTDDTQFAFNAGLALSGLVFTGKGADTMQKLGIDLPGRRYLQLVAHPDSPGYPHLAMGSLDMLELGLELYERSKAAACSA